MTIKKPTLKMQFEQLNIDFSALNAKYSALYVRHGNELGVLRQQLAAAETQLKQQTTTALADKMQMERKHRMELENARYAAVAMRDRYEQEHLDVMMMERQSIATTHELNYWRVACESLTLQRIQEGRARAQHDEAYAEVREKILIEGTKFKTPQRFDEFVKTAPQQLRARLMQLRDEVLAHTPLQISSRVVPDESNRPTTGVTGYAMSYDDKSGWASAAQNYEAVMAATSAAAAGSTTTVNGNKDKP